MGHHVPLPPIGAGVVSGVETDSPLASLPGQVLPRPVAVLTLVGLLWMEGPGTVVQEEVEALSTFAFYVVKEDIEEFLLGRQTLPI